MLQPALVAMRVERRILVSTATTIGIASSSTAVKSTGSSSSGLDSSSDGGSTDTGGMVVPPHPHTGLQTVSWLFEGEVEHRDSTGAGGVIRQGERQAELARLDDVGFRALFAKSPVKRIGRDRMMRNCLIAAGNSGDATLRAPVARLLDDPNAVVAEAAGWALARLA